MIYRLPYNDEIYRELRFLDPSVVLREESKVTFPELKNVAENVHIPDIS